MPPIVTLEITNGPLKGQKFDFPTPTRCSIGRGNDNSIRVPEAYERVSRNHCILEIDPPKVIVHDQNSLNGTYLNEQCLGRRGHTTPIPQALQDQDELRLGGTPSSTKDFLTLRIHSRAPVTCAVCGSQTRVDAPRHNRFVCENCRQDPEALRRHLEVGTESIANYDLLQKIGRGGFGVVYLARHRDTGQRVALKVMLPHIAHDLAMRRIFEREIENMRALHHPHIVELFEEGREDDVSYFTMEFCDRGSVSSLLKERGGKLPVEEALTLTFQAIDALEYAHQARIPNVRLADGSFGSGTGLVHRDIKPCNLLLANVKGQTVLKVGDYGLSKAWEQAGYSGVTRPGTKAGSFAYQPRQQIRGYRDSQPEVDVWATVATLYFMLSGATPRDLSPGIAPELTVLQTPVVKLRDRNPAVPPALATIIDTVLNDEADLALKSMSALRRELEAFRR